MSNIEQKLIDLYQNLFGVVPVATKRMPEPYPEQMSIHYILDEYELAILYRLTLKSQEERDAWNARFLDIREKIVQGFM